MNILLISPLPPPKGGIATWTELFINSKIQKTHSISLVNTAVKGARISNLSKINIIEEVFRTLSVYKEIRNSLINNTFDIVHVNTSCSKLGLIRDTLILAGLRKKIANLILHCHCDSSYQVKGKLSRFFFRRLCNFSKLIICLNKSSQDHIKMVTGKDSIIVPNFINLEHYEVKQANKFNDRIRSIIFVGHVIKTKGCTSIIEAAKQLPDITFKLVGYVSDYYRNIHVPANVVFFGETSRENVLREMQCSDLILLPSHTEGFPNVILEAMACALPIIATPVGAIPDIIEDKGGVLVGIEDVNGIVKAIETLDDLEIRKQMSEWNHKKLKDSYMIEHVVAIINNLYENEVKQV